jgi:hypothetical protein
MSLHDEREIDALFAKARTAYPTEIEPSPEFLSGVWAKVEAARPTDWLAVIERWSPRIALAGLAAAVMMTVSVWAPNDARERALALQTGYLEALSADSMDKHDGAMWLLAGMKK